MLPRIAETRTVDYVGLGYRGSGEGYRGVNIHPCDFEGRDAFGAHATAILVESLRPGAVLVFNDLWFLDRYRRAIAPVLGKGRLVAYLPLDGEVSNVELVRPLLDYDVVVVYTEWARRQLDRALTDLGGADSGDAHASTEGPRSPRRPQIEVIGHGVDTDAFRPRRDLARADFATEGRLEAKRRVFPQLTKPQDAFIVLNASRPSLRKRIDLSIDGFRRFRQELPEAHRDRVYLCLHQAVGAEVEESSIREQIGALGLVDHVLYRTPERLWSDEELNDLYNACDVGLNTATGEGWGLVSFEHAAAGGRQVVPDHSACAELWREHGILVPVSRKAEFSYSPLRLSEVSAEHVAIGLREAYDLRQGRGLAEAAEWTRGRPFRWEAIGESWRALLAAPAPGC
ncbi:MAG: glycosyltransferase [Thermoanaerobaculia bacterium]|nr:glycosyltransferase [Thermoanaerobaculia bacterium]